MVDKSMKLTRSNFISYKRGSIASEYKISSKALGSGSFGTVKKVLHKKTNQERACKILKKSDQDVDKFFLEVEILSKLSHPNIMQIYEFYDDNKNFYIISELCKGGELYEMIIKKGFLTEYEAAVIMKQLLSAICYSHKNNVVHRDLKPENILLDDKNDTLLIKLIDWGGARYYQKNKKMSKLHGTPYYIAPEVLNADYDEKCDIWSAGVILYILLCGYPPFGGDSEEEIMEEVKNGKFDFPEKEWKSVNPHAKELIQKMLTKNPADRITANQCLAHKWFEILNSKNKPSSSEKLISAVSNMKVFKKERKLEQATTAFIVNQIMAKEDRNEMISMFQKWDKDNDGVLSRDEIFEGYKEIYGEVKALEEVDAIMEKIDLDGDGTIDYNEFLVATINRSKMLNDANLEAAFNMFDKVNPLILGPFEYNFYFGDHGDFQRD